MANPILLYTPIFAEVAEAFTEKVFEHKEDKPIEVWVNGPGGSLSAGWSMLAALNEKGFNTTVTGDASSFYFYMLLFSEHNTAFDTSNFLVHRAASMWESMMSEDELKEVESRNKIIRKKMEARIDEAKFTEVTGKTFDDIFDMEGQLDVRLNAREMKKIGLIDKVIKLDVKKREEIESRYFTDIAALANPTKSNNNNSNKNKMGKLADLIFGEKDPVLIAQIGETQFVYSKTEKGAKVKATGAGDHDPISGTFDADNKKVTVVDNEITAVTEIDTKQEQINALSSKIIALTALIEDATKKPVKTEKVDNSQKQIDTLTSQVTALTKTLTDAKLSVSSPGLPEGEFKKDVVVNDDLTLREKLQIEQNAMHEAKIKTREV